MKFEDKKEKSIVELLTTFNTALKKYWRIAIGPALVLAALSLILGSRMSDYYQSDFLIYIQPQRIKSELIESPDQEEMGEKMEALLQEILSRPRLRTIIERFSLYPELTGPAGKEAAIEKFRNAIYIGPAKSATGVMLLQTFRITFIHQDAKTAFEIAQDISDLFIEESVVQGRSQIQGETEFLDAELLQARKKLEGMEQKMQEFVKSNFDKLPENLNAAIARLENAQTQLSTNTQLISTTLARKEGLQREYNSVKSMVSAGSANSGQPESGDPYSQLAQLESALVVLASRYSAKHPDVINTQKRISTLKAQLKSSGSRRGGSSVVVGESLAARGVRLQLEDANIRLVALEKENETLKESISKLERDIQQMPLKEQELLKIKRDYDNVKENYQKLLSARQDAGLKESLVKGQKATQFRIVEPAELPNIPAGPNRALAFVGGIVGASLLFLVIPFILSMLNGAYKFTGEVENELDIEVIGIVPPMVTPQSVVDNRKVYALCSVISLLALTGGSLALFLVV